MAEDFYRRLIELNEATFARGNFDAAYHVLMAALHSARNDLEALEEVRQIALRQLTTIDAKHPEYDHSSASARTRGHLSIFEMLAEQARALAAIARTPKKTSER